MKDFPERYDFGLHNGREPYGKGTRLFLALL
jgi:hypothetical protein